MRWWGAGATVEPGAGRESPRYSAGTPSRRRFCLNTYLSDRDLAHATFVCLVRPEPVLSPSPLRDCPDRGRVERAPPGRTQVRNRGHTADHHRPPVMLHAAPGPCPSPFVPPPVLRDADHSSRRPLPIFLLSGDGHEPPHVHVERDDGVAKFWLHPVRLASGGAFGQRELGRIRTLVELSHATFAEAWHDYFSR